MNKLILISTVHCRKVLSAMTKFYFLTCSKWYYFPVMFDLVVMYADIHQAKSITQSNNYMETRRMEGHTISLFIEGLIGLDGALLIIPYSNEFINATGHDQRFSNADIHPVYWSSMEGLGNHLKLLFYL